MLRIDVCSDLHVDYHNRDEAKNGPRRINERGEAIDFDFGYHRNPGSSILIIAGDVTDHIDQLEDVVMEAAKHYDKIIYTDGNHEFHGNASFSNVRHNMDDIEAIGMATDKFVYLNGLNKVHHQIGRTMFIGGNCWYDWRCFEDRGVPFPLAFAAWDDNSRDKDLHFGSFGWPNVLGSAQIDNIEAALDTAIADPDIDSIVVVTHTAPLAECLPWKDEAFNLASPSYANSQLRPLLDKDHKQKLKLWAHGNTHTNRRWLYNGVTIVNNCFGYPEENTGGWTMQVVEVI